MIQFRWAQPRVHAHPERLVHDPIRLIKASADTECVTRHRGLPNEVPGEDQSGTDLRRFETREEFHAGHLR